MPKAIPATTRLDRQLLRLMDRRERIIAQIEILTLTLRQLDRQIASNHDERKCLGERTRA